MRRKVQIDGLTPSQSVSPFELSELFFGQCGVVACTGSTVVAAAHP